MLGIELLYTTLTRFAYTAFRLNKNCSVSWAVLAVPTGFEPAISALTGPHVWPLHHGTIRPGVILP